MSFHKLIETLNKQKISYDPERLKKVFDFAAAAHEGQLRYSGEKYIEHPLQVARILAGLGQSAEVIEAALLHDTVEDNPTITLEQIEKEFGPDVAFLVDGVTKVGKVRLRGSTDQIFVENLRKMFVAMAQDIRVVLIRLADRLHNMQTLDAIPLSKQKRIAQETLEVYAPLAERLGMGFLKGQLEDLAFAYALPKEYHWVTSLSLPHFHHAEETTKHLIRQMKQKLQENNIRALVHGRHKHKYSLYKKLLRPEINKDIKKIHDLIALRIITDNKLNCYSALGIIHTHWKPVPHIGVSDFIAQPKPNGYQSIHTKIFDKSGRIVEIQIRSEAMHQQAEFGAAAHFVYSEAKAKGLSSTELDKGKISLDLGKKMDWVKQLAAWQAEIGSNEEFVKNLKLDALSSRIYVFSPKGDVFDLPSQATPIDFAFAVHSGLGNFVQAAKVNGKIVSLNYQLSSGDVVEIIKSKNPRKPTKDWIRFAKTQKAIAKIRQLNPE